MRDVSVAREPDPKPVEAPPERGRGSTKHMHQRLLRALSDRRVKRAFGS